MKLGIAIYHKDIHRYRPEWIDQCFKSLLENVWMLVTHTPTEIKAFELNYGESGGKAHILSPLAHNQVPLVNYAAAMNYCYDTLFSIYQCDVVANVNLDDYYSPYRFRVLLPFITDLECDIVSSNYILVNENGEEIRRTDFGHLHIYKELRGGNNIVSNPCHLMKRRVFDALQFDPDLVPKEDLAYWIRCIDAGFRICISEDYLHYYRIHPHQSGNIC